MKASKLKRSGDEHYTPEWVVEKYLAPFVKDRFVYTPFGKDSTVKRVLSRYTTVIDTPLKYNQGDFFAAIANPEFIAFLKSRKACVCDNPPFSSSVKIYKALTGFDYFLIGNTLSALRTCPNAFYKVIGAIKYESGKQVNSCIASNTFTSIEAFSPRSNKWMEVKKRCTGKYFSSARVENLVMAGAIIHKSDILAYVPGLFGGGIQINFSTIKTKPVLTK